ncbi:MAG: TRAP transporter substrate-binding protein [Syntrophales bacterium]|nr:TRAP transporter substrate-binding protein [Syntrophales bacterium]
MKKNLLIIVMIGAAALLLTMGCQRQEKTVELTYSIFFPPTHSQCKAAISWAEEIEKRSGGKIKITTFPGGTLTKADQCYDGVVKGISDIGMSCFAYTRGRFPVMAAVDLPHGYADGLVATRVANEFAKTMAPKELDDVKVLYIHAHGPGLLSTKKAVRTLEDVKGMKIRSTGLSAKIVEALGGAPVAMPQGDTYEALQKGVVEGTFTPIETLKGWRQAEVIKYTTKCTDVGYTTAMFVVINLEKWNALPKELRKIMEEVSAEWVGVHGEEWDKSDDEGREYTLSQGNEIIDLSQEEHERWAKAVQPIIEEYISTTEASGLPGKEAVARVKELIATYSK